jgi:hypothetical protein
VGGLIVHYKNLLDPGKFLGPCDFQQEREVTISRVSREKMPARDGEPEQSAPMMFIVAKDGSEYARPYKVPKSVMYGLSLALGVETDAWKGQKVGIYAAKCMSFGDVEECLRIRFAPEIDAKIRKWMKKRKANPSAYIIKES